MSNQANAGSSPLDEGRNDLRGDLANADAENRSSTSDSAGAYDTDTGAADNTAFDTTASEALVGTTSDPLTRDDPSDRTPGLGYAEYVSESASTESTLDDDTTETSADPATASDGTASNQPVDSTLDADAETVTTAGGESALDAAAAQGPLTWTVRPEDEEPPLPDSEGAR